MNGIYQKTTEKKTTNEIKEIFKFAKKAKFSDQSIAYKNLYEKKN